MSETETNEHMNKLQNRTLFFMLSYSTILN